MNRSVLIAVIVVLVAAITLVILGLTRTVGTSSTSNATTNVNTPGEAGSGSAGNSAGADLVRELNAVITYRTGTLTARRAEVRKKVGGFSATAGTKFVVVNFEPSTMTFDAPFVSWLTNEIALLDSENTATKPTFAHMEGESATSADDNYLAFRVDAGARDFTLRFLRDGEEKRLTLGF